MPAGPGHLVRSLIAGLAAHIVAGHQLLHCGHAHGEGLVGQDIGGGPVVGADAHAQLLFIADATPGCVHGVGGAVLVVGRQDQDRLGIESGLCSNCDYMLYIDFQAVYL